jgi:hypothetical protein
VLFPVGSHFAANAFIEFPVFSVSATGSINAVFYLRFLYGWEHWEEWELNSNRRTSTARAAEQEWNDREQIQWSAIFLHAQRGGAASDEDLRFAAFSSTSPTRACSATV